MSTYLGTGTNTYGNLFGAGTQLYGDFGAALVTITPKTGTLVSGSHAALISAGQHTTTATDGVHAATFTES
jgi:hypothetical protein